jgi:Lsr2
MTPLALKNKKHETLGAWFELPTGYAVSQIRQTTHGVCGMAQKIQTLFVDDIDGGAAEGTVRFALDGTDYEIDLSGKHSDELHAALQRYVEHARKVGGQARRTARGGGRRGSNAIDTARVREWARAEGYDIKDRGRVPGELVAKYQEAVRA